MSISYKKPDGTWTNISNAQNSLYYTKSEANDLFLFGKTETATATITPINCTIVDNSSLWVYKGLYLINLELCTTADIFLSKTPLAVAEIAGITVGNGSLAVHVPTLDNGGAFDDVVQASYRSDNKIYIASEALDATWQANHTYSAGTTIFITGLIAYS